MLVLMPLLAACGGGAAPTPPPPPPPPPAATPSAIPHPMEGRDNCLMCHTSGDVAVPANHAGRTNDTCTGCHKPAG
jgi:hypothetical protein